MSDNTIRAPQGVARAAVTGAAIRVAPAETTTFAILVSLSFCHMLNDMNQSLVPAIYPDPEGLHHSISPRSA